MNAETSISLPPIAGYHPTTLIDWPGRLAAIVFLPQCNLRCPFCHAGPMLAAPEEAIALESVLEHIASRDGWLDGVVICGGEPTLWPTLPDFCRVFRDVGLAVKLDTNGTQPAVLASLAEQGLIDAVSMDLKAPLDERYSRACGGPVDLETLRQSIRLLMKSGLDYEFRTTVCPPLVGEAEIRAMGASILGARRWVLQRFEPTYALDPALRVTLPYDLPMMETLAEIGSHYVARCVIRGQPQKRPGDSCKD